MTVYSTAYTTGTITLINGSAAIVGTGTAWTTAVIAGGTIYPSAAGNALPIAEIVDDTHITAAIAWRGASGTYTYALMRDTTYGQQTVTNAQGLATILAQLANKVIGALASLSSTMVADRLPYATGTAAMAWTNLTDYARTLLDDANAATARGTLGAVSKTGDTFTGAVTIETTANVARLAVRGYGQGQGYGAVYRTGTDTGTAGAILFQNSSAGWVGEITQSVTSVVYGTASDHRLKCDVQPLVTDFELTADGFDMLDEAHLRVMAMRPVSYYWSAHPDVGRQTGFLAHELQLTSPHAVTGDKDGVEAIGTATIATGTDTEPQVIPDVRAGEIPDADWVQTGTRPVYQSVDHSKIVPDLVAAVQRLTVLTLEQMTQITALTAQIAALETTTSQTE